LFQIIIKSFTGGFTDDGSEFQKTYFLSRWIGDIWSGAKSFCTSFNLQLTTLETLEEARAFLKMVDSHPYFKIYNDANFYMDGMTSILRSTTEWYWTNTGNKISFPIPWLPGQPDNATPDERCFGFRRSNANQKFGFSDFNCKTFTPHFTCQRIDLFIP